jgi:translation initiation factor 2 subunit 3
MAENDIADFQADEGAMLAADAGLSQQDLSKLDPNNLRPDTFEVMSRQATVNIGTIGHVAHGKSTVVKAMSGVRTTKFKKEAVMNITIHLGYANAKIFKCTVCPEPQCYQAFGSAQADQSPCLLCKAPLTLVRHVSFVDCPGHDVLMATMLNGAAIMDAALLLIAANETFPQAQTKEHLFAVEIMKLRNIIVLQNKIDLVKRDVALEQATHIRFFLESSTTIPAAPILPICAERRINMDAVLQYICHIPQPVKDLACPPSLLVVRSFDINAPGSPLEALVGGVMGGSVQRGVLRVGQRVQVRPGIVRELEAVTPPVSSQPSPQSSPTSSVSPSSIILQRGAATVPFAVPSPRRRFSFMPLVTTVTSLRTEQNDLACAVPGGLIAVGTNLDPTLTRQNKLAGQLVTVAGAADAVAVLFELEVAVYLLRFLVGNKSSGQKRVAPLLAGETLQVGIRTFSTAGTVVATVPAKAKLALVAPACCKVGDVVTLSRLQTEEPPKGQSGRAEKKFRLIGWGTIHRGVAAEEAT